ncbi:uncharacterized protein AMSG_04756 [Thecamonas trahens ATCC 50062]|uniref:Uncharacterized protein n=1 Tax=Thecamonas trahens ATCC 50062 TaxID=461836 RepID=A0A0L0DCH7_THETB|nr:hypothetical protein AMSG_04756 [Thecamonas trahens ATCC 50062]KNC49013.1 hypothetical protein AMSG_04756 [Thecamonas trahens ATCC 50062]|eukprot:XP_013758424.1 hypothetical protein AMSG_04756 [Thecamonas trahens ATCC 50062]
MLPVPSAVSAAATSSPSDAASTLLVHLCRGTDEAANGASRCSQADESAAKTADAGASGENVDSSLWRLDPGYHAHIHELFPLPLDSGSEVTTANLELPSDHIHGPNCGHARILHDDHFDYLVDSWLHHVETGVDEFHGRVPDLTPLPLPPVCSTAPPPSPNIPPLPPPPTSRR